MIRDMADLKEKTRFTKGEIKGDWLLGALPQMTKDSLKFLDDCAQSGDIVTYRFVNQKLHGLHHPDLIKEVLLNQYEVFVKEGIYSRLNPVFRNGLLTAKGEFWKKQRRTIQPAFTRKNLQSMIQTMQSVVLNFHDDMMEFAEGGKPIDMFSQMLRLALDMINRTMFSNDVSQRHLEIAEHIYALNVFMKKRNFSVLPLPVWMPTKDNRSFKKALNALDEIVMEIVEKRLSSGEFGDDLLGMLLSSKDPETGERMSISQVRAEAVTIFITGHETTATAMTWAYYLLSKSPGSLKEVHASIDDVFSQLEISDMTGMLDELKFLDDILMESIRMRPPIYVTYRRASKDTEICGYKIKKGESVHLSPYIMNKDQRCWTAPETFNPSRFQNGEGSNKFAFFPFGAGPRSCIGSHFTILEARMILAILGRSFQFELVSPDEEMEPEPLVTLKPRDPVMMWVKKRV